MVRSHDWFAIGALILLLLGLYCRFFVPAVKFTVQWHGIGYLFPLASAFVLFATSTAFSPLYILFG